jgi:hypothetical protein
VKGGRPWRHDRPRSVPVRPGGIGVKATVIPGQVDRFLQARAITDDYWMVLPPFNLNFRFPNDVVFALRCQADDAIAA